MTAAAVANRSDLAVGTAAAVLGAALIFWIVPAATGPALFALVSPQFYPLLAAWLLVAAGAGLAVSGIGGAAVDVPRRRGAAAAVAAAGLGSAVFLMLKIGFVAAGAAVVLAVMLLAGERRIPFLVGLPATLPFLLWLLFDVLLGRPLP